MMMMKMIVMMVIVMISFDYQDELKKPFQTWTKTD